MFSFKQNSQMLTIKMYNFWTKPGQICTFCEKPFVYVFSTNSQYSYHFINYCGRRPAGRFPFPKWNQKPEFRMKMRNTDECAPNVPFSMCFLKEYEKEKKTVSKKYSNKFSLVSTAAHRIASPQAMMVYAYIFVSSNDDSLQIQFFSLLIFLFEEKIASSRSTATR